MRILKVTQSYPPFLDKGGLPVKVAALAGHLAARGHEITVLTARHRENEPLESQSSVRAVYLPVLLRYRTQTLNRGLWSFCRRLDDFDLVHIYGTYDFLGPGVAWHCRRRGLPYLLEPCGMYPPIVRSLRKKRLYDICVLGPLIRGASLLVATSLFEKDSLIAAGIGEERLRLRRNGIELPQTPLPQKGIFRRRISCPPDQPLILYLGRLSRKKGLDLLIQSFRRLKQPACLAVVGPDDQDGTLEMIQALLQGLPAGKTAVLTGALFGQDKLAALNDADVLVLPSLSENFGNVAGESIACGTPVIVSDRCGIAPFIDRRAGLVVSLDGSLSGDRKPFEALASGLQCLLQNRELRERLVSGCAQVAQELSWKTAVDVQEEIYRSMAVSCPGKGGAGTGNSSASTEQRVRLH